FRRTGITSRLLDPHFDQVGTRGRHDAWLQDQYCHPHETSHTLDEALAWMAADGFDFVNSIPKPAVGPELTDRDRLFEAQPRGTSLGRIASQLASMSSGYREGGFFIVIGRKR